MCAEYRFKTPLGAEDVQRLRLGDTVFLDGELVLMPTVPTYKRAIACAQKGEGASLGLENAVVFHGVNYSREVAGGHEVVYFGTTTSMRMDPFTPELIDNYHIRAFIGKGGLGAGSVAAMREHGCVYLAVIGAGLPIFSSSIREVTSVLWQESHPLQRLITVRAEGFGPTTVSIDAQGHSLYEQVGADALARLPDILERLSATEK